MENENGSAIAEVAAPINDRGPESIQKNPDPVPKLNTDIKTASDNIEPKPADVAKSDEIKKMNNLLKDLEGESDSEGLENIVKKATALAADSVSNNETKITTTSISLNVKTTTLSTSNNSNSVSETETKTIVSETTKVGAVNNDAVDIEMEDLTVDVDMKDISNDKVNPESIVVSAKPEKPAASADTKTEANKATKATGSASSEKSENQQKIDDVEKNISNLFNGDETADQLLHSEKKIDKPVKGNEKSGEKQQQSDAVSTSTELKSNNSTESKTPSKEPVAIDKEAESSKDLVSILTDDKPRAKDQAEPKKINDIARKATVKVSTTDSAPKPTAENKLLTNIAKSITSTPSSSTTQSVFNSTPIQKQFDISSENVSTISEAATDQSPCIGDKSTHQEIISSHSSTSNVNSSETTTVSESDHQSSDTLTRYAKVIGKYNGIGIGDTTDDASASDTTKISKQKATSTEASAAVGGVSSSFEEKIYDINIWYENNDLVYLCVEKQPQTKSADLSTEHISSEGSVGSLSEPYSLPVRSITVTSTNSTLSTSSASNASKLDASKKLDGSSTVLSKTKHIVKGTVAMYDFLIEHLQKARKTVAGSEEDLHTPSTSRGRGRTSAAVKDTPSSTTSASKRKRGATDTEEEDNKSGSAKKIKKEKPAAELAIDSNYPEKAVLARWVDKKFYAGHVVEQKPNNKYVVIFEDGAKKILPEDHIVFGKGNVLPLENEFVHALVKDDTYEPGLVQSVKNKGDTVLYTVACDSGTITVTASNIYLEDDQAKIILSKHANTSVNSPEPGFSGGINTRKDRRQKRTAYKQQPQWFSESDVSDIIESDSTPASPTPMALEAVVGVQPELQHNQKESELVRLRFLIEAFGNDYKSIKLDNILGPIVEKKIFRNKGFLLTCTIPIKGAESGEQLNNNINDLTKKNMNFSTIPFFKDYLKKQIESAGGTVFNNFEDVPKKKYRSCFLLAQYPCTTAKYVQCLAANITTLSHQWIIECCQEQKLLNKDIYELPSGWSIIEQSYKKWSVGRGKNQRKSLTPFDKETIILTSQQNDFVQFWSRVCKMGGAKIRLVRSTSDITATTKGYVLMDDEFPPEFAAKAANFQIPVVSTVWVVQSLILGKICDPRAHPHLTRTDDDEDF